MTITIQQAVAAHNQGKHKEAEQLYREILKVDSNHLDANNNLGALLYGLDRLEEAEKSYNKAIELKPDFVEGHYNLAITLQKLNKLEEAERCYKKVIELKPDYVEAHFNLGHVLNILNKLNESMKSYEKVIELEPNNATTHNNIGSLLVKLNKLEEAEISYKKALKLKPDYLLAKSNVNTLERQNKLLVKLKEANKTTERAKANEPNLSTRLVSTPFISERRVEDELVAKLYKLNSKEISEAKKIQLEHKDARYGNGRCSDFEFLKDNSKILKVVTEELTKIMEQAVKSKIYIYDSFFNILRSGGGTNPHAHITAFDTKHALEKRKYSLTYYLSIGDQNCSEPGILKLYDPDEDILPSKGKIVIIPAMQKHSATYNGKEDRIMIGINFYSIF